MSPSPASSGLAASASRARSAAICFSCSSSRRRNLFSDTTYADHWISIPHIIYWSGFFFLLFFLWAFPVHYAARNILDARAGSWFRKRRPAAKSKANSARRAEIDRKLIEWTPRALGAIPIVAVLIGILSAAMQTNKAQVLVPGLELQYSLLVAGALATLLMFVIAMMKRKRLVSRWLGDPAAERLRLFSLVLTAAIFAVLWVAPIHATALFARAVLIPVLFGSWVLAFAWITKRSDRSGHPYLLYIFLAAAFLTALNAHFNDVRTLPGEAKGDGRQLEMPEAVRLWREANGCPISADPETEKKVRGSCPPALIIAAEGGASRAAYFTATVVGEMLDAFKLPYLADAPTAQANNPARRIFAMSGVSGGALGFAIVKAALLDFADAKPCNKEDGKWRPCLQDLVSGDYLSPVFVGLGFRDQVAPPIFPFNDANRWGDRAALLEIAWERQYMRASGEVVWGLPGRGERARPLPAIRLSRQREALDAAPPPQRHIGRNRPAHHRLGDCIDLAGQQQARAEWRGAERAALPLGL